MCSTFLPVLMPLFYTEPADVPLDCESYDDYKCVEDSECMIAHCLSRGETLDLKNGEHHLRYPILPPKGLGSFIID